MVEELTYYWGLFEVPEVASIERAIKRVRFDVSTMPEPVSKSFEAERIAELEGGFGLPDVGEPTEVDHLEYSLGGSTRTIRVVNRGISVFHAETPELVRLHCFFCVLQNQTPGNG